MCRLNRATIREEWYAFSSQEADAACCIGHLRADYGHGSEFWTTWFPHKHDELNTPIFKTAFNQFMNELRESIPTRAAARRCNSGVKPCHPYFRSDGNTRIYRCDIGEEDGSRYALIVRLSPREGDYDMYVYAYPKDALDKALAADAELTLYQRVKKLGVTDEDIANHESDLYLRATPTTDLAICQWVDAKGYARENFVKEFTDNIEGKRWYDVAFAYDPFWAEKAGKEGAQ